MIFSLNMKLTDLGWTELELVGVGLLVVRCSEMTLVVNWHKNNYIELIETHLKHVWNKQQKIQEI